VIDTRTASAPAVTTRDTHRAMTTGDIRRIKQLLALGLIERVIVPGASPRIRYRHIEGAVPQLVMRVPSHSR
jgi:hypothetical protein